jgi:hypothetical protein
VTDATAACISFGDTYWPRFGLRWLASVERADPQPDAVIICSDREIDIPTWLDVQLIISDKVGIHMWDDIAKMCRTTWIAGIGLDDEYVVDAFEGLTGDYDAIAFGCQQQGEATSIAWPAGQDAYSLTWQSPNNPMNGGQFFRASSLLEIPLRDYIYADEVLWAEWSYFGKTIKFENRVRQIWHRWSGANSWPANRAGEQQAQDFKRRLREGLIQKGVPE